MLRKNPMNTNEFFHAICDVLKEKDLMPDSLEYSNGAYNPVPIRTMDFSIENNLDYGDSEGIYLDLRLHFYDGSQEGECFALGTFKTLGTSTEDMHIMARLLADFLVEARHYVNSHSDDFTWEGYSISRIKRDGTKDPVTVFCGTEDVMVKFREGWLASSDKYSGVVVKDYTIRTETEYWEGEGNAQ